MAITSLQQKLKDQIKQTLLKELLMFILKLIDYSIYKMDFSHFKIEMIAYEKFWILIKKYICLMKSGFLMSEINKLVQTENLNIFKIVFNESR